MGGHTSRGLLVIGALALSCSGRSRLDGGSLGTESAAGAAASRNSNSGAGGDENSATMAGAGGGRAGAGTTVFPPSPWPQEARCFSLGAAEAGAAGESGEGPTPSAGGAASITDPPQLLTRFPLALDIDAIDGIWVDGNRDQAYSFTNRFDLSDLENISETPLPQQGFAAVDPNTGRYALIADGLAQIHPLLVYNADGTLYDSQPLSGNATGIGFDTSRSLFYVATFDENRLVVYDEAKREVTQNQLLDVHPYNLVVDQSSGDLYLTAYDLATSELGVSRLDPDLVAHESLRGRVVLAADGAAGRLLVADAKNTHPELRTSGTFALIRALDQVEVRSGAFDPLLRRIYAFDNRQVTVLDECSGAALASFANTDGYHPVGYGFGFAAGDDRIYVPTHKEPSGSFLEVYATH